VAVIGSCTYADGDLRLMLDLVSELWPHGRHGIGYAFMAQRLPFDDRQARLWFDDEELVGWAWSTGWKRPVSLSYEFRPGFRALLGEMLEWAEPETLTVRSGDRATAAALRRRGFDRDLRWNARALDDLEEPVVPAGYRLTTMAEHADFASRSAARRSAFAPSRFADGVYDTVLREAPWRADLDCVVVDPRGKVAAFALGWLDQRNRVCELEPVGVRAGEQRRGLGRAVCLYALRQLRAAGAETALVGSRGDDAYPGPRKLYESIGFREAWRNLVFVRR
jgi:GNAT superfamily N-acetyltransferase